MTAPPSAHAPITPLYLFRRHLREMLTYADQLEAVLGRKSPIVKRIKDCSASNTKALDEISERQRVALAILAKAT